MFLESLSSELFKKVYFYDPVILKKNKSYPRQFFFFVDFLPTKVGVKLLLSVRSTEHNMKTKSLIFQI